MVKMFKKLVCASLLSLGALSATAANAGNKEGDVCVWSFATMSHTKFQCTYLFDGQLVTMQDIYNKGYQVVAMSKMDRALMIVVEKQN